MNLTCSSETCEYQIVSSLSKSGSKDTALIMQQIFGYRNDHIGTLYLELRFLVRRDVSCVSRLKFASSVRRCSESVSCWSWCCSCCCFCVALVKINFQFCFFIFVSHSKYLTFVCRSVQLFTTVHFVMFFLFFSFSFRSSRRRVGHMCRDTFQVAKS